LEAVKKYKDMKEETLLIDNKNIFCRTMGAGTPVVLLHGFGEDGNIWKKQYDAFPGVQLIIPDLPGSGKSELTEDMSMEGMAKTIHQVLEKLNINSFILVGHSMGGYISLAFAALYPNRLTALGLLHSSAFADSEEKIATRKKGIEFTRQHGAFEFLKTAIPNLYAPETRTKYPEMIEDHIMSCSEFSDEALIRYYTAMIKRPERTEVLKNAAYPILFILGRHDTAVPMADGLKQSPLPAVAHVTILENSGHMGMLEEPELCNRAMELFIHLRN
jgi:pimeloyl-ACP methyl ester carboxylesterase